MTPQEMHKLLGHPPYYVQSVFYEMGVWTATSERRQGRTTAVAIKALSFASDTAGVVAIFAESTHAKRVMEDTLTDFIKRFSLPPHVRDLILVEADPYKLKGVKYDLQLED